ncbi:hypothetical protein BD769DRAFT_1393674 [Suillus cothurnatus]|nr:hypothetical protein BD769DRAFT_1393674 [Suillus cothurnatus]
MPRTILGFLSIYHIAYHAITSNIASKTQFAQKMISPILKHHNGVWSLDIVIKILGFLSTPLPYTSYIENPSIVKIICKYIVIQLDKIKTMTKCSAPSQDEHKAKCIRVEALLALQHPGAWVILKCFLTTDLTFSAIEEGFNVYLTTKLAIFSGDGNDALSLTNLLVLKHQYIQDDDNIKEAPLLLEDDIKIMDYPICSHKIPFLNIKANEDDEFDDEIKDGVPSHASMTLWPMPQYNLADTIHRIEQSYQSSSSITIHQHLPVCTCKIAPLPTRKIPTRMYIFTVNGITVSAQEYLAEHLEKQGISIVISLWIAAHLYVTSDSPQTIMSAIPKFLKMSMKKWDHISNKEETTVNALHLKFPYPTWFRIKQGKYRENLFVTMLIPPKDFPYDVPKDVTVLFNHSYLPTPPSNIIHNREVVGYKFKGKEYYSGLLKKNFHHYCTKLPHFHDYCTKLICIVINTDHAFGGLAKLEFNFNGQQKAIKAKLDHVESSGYSGVQGHIVESNEDIFTICQSGMLEQIEVSKYYLDHHPIDWTLQGKCGIVQWALGGFIWFQDDGELIKANDDSSMVPPFIHIAASSIQCTCLPATITLTKDYGYDLRPRDAVCVACGPEFHTEGVMCAIDFASAWLTLETELLELMHNAPLNTFNKFINKEVFVIGGIKKGYCATLYNISTDTCIITVHNQPYMTIRCCDVATIKSYVTLPPRSITPPPEKTASSSADHGQSFTWASWSQEDLAEMSSETEMTEDPWTINTNDIVELAQPKAHDPICWLKEFSL